MRRKPGGHRGRQKKDVSKLSSNSQNTNESTEQISKTTKNSITPLIIVAIILGVGSVFFWILPKNQSGFFVLFCKFVAILFGLYSLFLLVSLLPETRFRKILDHIIGVPLSILYMFVEFGYYAYFIGAAIIIIFIIPALIFILINKCVGVHLIDFRLWYFIAFFLTLIIVSYLKTVIIWVLRVLHLPKSEKKKDIINNP
jgi:hypothetical protein